MNISKIKKTIFIFLGVSFLLSVNSVYSEIAQDWERRLNLGRIFLEEGNLEMAEYQIERGLETAPNEIDLLLTLGSIYRFRGFLGKALNTFNRILEIEDSNVDVMREIAWTYFQMEEYDKTIYFLEKIVEIKPSAENYLNLAWIYLELQETDKIKYLIEKAKQYNQQETDPSVKTRITNFIENIQEVID